MRRTPRCPPPFDATTSESDAALRDAHRGWRWVARGPTAWRSSCRAHPMVRPRSASRAVGSATKARHAERRHRVRHVLRRRRHRSRGRETTSRSLPMATCSRTLAIRPCRRSNLNDGVVRNVCGFDHDADFKSSWRSTCPDGPAKPTLRAAARLRLRFREPPWAASVYFGFSAASGSSKNDHDLQGEASVRDLQATEVPLVGRFAPARRSADQNTRADVSAAPLDHLLIRLGCFGERGQGPAIERRNQNRSGQRRERRDRPP